MNIRFAWTESRKIAGSSDVHLLHFEADYVCKISECWGNVAIHISLMKKTVVLGLAQKYSSIYVISNDINICGDTPYIFQNMEL